MQCRLSAMADAQRVSDTLPKKGKVTQVCKEWLVHEDGALAYALQKQEVEKHYHANKWRNAVVREDFPLALTEQRKEEEAAMIRYQQQVQALETRDEELARDLAMRLEAEEQEERRKKSELDHRLALHIQVKEGNSVGDMNTVGLPLSVATQQAHTTLRELRLSGEEEDEPPPMLPPRRPSPHHTVPPPAPPPPPVNKHSLDRSSPPIQPQPPVSNERVENTPEDYSQITPREIEEMPPQPTRIEKIELLTSAQTRLTSSHHSGMKSENVEEDLWDGGRSRVTAGPSRDDPSWPPPPTTPELTRHSQELKDEEVARRLQEELETEADMLERDHLLAMEAQDMEIAKMLQDKERARARRAKEKAKAKALAKQQEDQASRLKKDEIEENEDTSDKIVLEDANQSKNMPVEATVTGNSSVSSVLHPVGGPVPNIAAAIDPTFSLARQSSSPSSNHSHSRQPSHESLGDDGGLPYFPVQGQKRTSSLDKKKKKDKGKDSTCKQQ